MAHFLCSPLGSAGDVYPMVGLALELQGLGHDVTFLVNEYFEPVVSRLGLVYEEFGTRDEFLQLAGDPRLWQGMSALKYIVQVGILPNMRRHYELCAAHFRNDPSTTVITSVLGVGARVAQDHLGIPVVSLHLQPSVMWSDVEPPRLPGMFGPVLLRRWLYRLAHRLVVDPMICPQLNAWRRELGLPPVRHALNWWHSPTSIACLFPSWFAQPQPDWPGPLIQTDFPLWDVPDGPTMPPAVQAFLDDGEPPIVFTPGSANLFGESFFRAAADACHRLDRRGLLLTKFPQQIPANLANQVMHADYAPFSELLPRSALLVHHGGIGSMSQAMAAGIPQLIVALAHDQFDNAYRVRRLGVGGPVRGRTLSGARLSRELSRWLDSHEVTAKCQELRQRLSRRDGLRQLAQALG